MNREIKPLYRKVNTKARGHHHNTGDDAKYDRKTKEGLKRSMTKDKLRGLDFTPLYKFLLSKVGQDWDAIHSEAIARLPKENHDAIFHIVYSAKRAQIDPYGIERGYVMTGESSRFSYLKVDQEGKLQLANPELKNEHIKPTCSCCTHTLNGKVLINKYQ